MNDLVDRILAGDVRAAARAMRMVDDRTPGHLDVLKALWAHTGRAWVIGVTGTPGAGKSTLVDRMIEAARGRGQRVGVVAVDPSSPFSGGAILGDRIRMQRHFLDDGVFIRSLATRGHLGGVSRSAGDIVRVLDAFGSDLVILETVGVGQDELEVTRLAHTTIVVMAPGMGDDVQAIKAGILEVADVFAVNKADREGADSTVRDLEQMISLGAQTFVAGAHSRSHGHGALDVARARAQHAADVWVPPVVKTVALAGTGLVELVAAAERHRAWLETSGAGARRVRGRLEQELDAIFRDTLLDSVRDRAHPALVAAADRVARREQDPYTAAETIARAMIPGQAPA